MDKNGMKKDIIKMIIKNWIKRNTIIMERI